jgi:hypothetical protein
MIVLRCHSYADVLSVSLIASIQGNYQVAALDVRGKGRKALVESRGHPSLATQYTSGNMYALKSYLRTIF